MPARIPVRLAFNGTNCSSSVRAFSSTSPTLALGPESPNYIEVPKPAQPTWTLEPKPKGHLPIPRDVFKTRSRLPKASEQFISRTTKDPAKAKLPGPYNKDAEYRLYKQRLAEARRNNFREGVKALHERKVTSEAESKARYEKLNTEKRALTFAPPRTVDVLTQASVSKSVRDFLSDCLSQNPSPAGVQARRKAFTRRMNKQDTIRQARVHDLYTNARKFIVTEQQLDESIEEAFGTDDQPVRWNKNGQVESGSSGISPWEGGIPNGIHEKMKSLGGGQGVGLAKERVKKIAEELTGGKM
ncbi:unnamed protein product [Periconia digitata]|uniref:Uncharacterized protein n=1 Tax=Periconia digitata TaxID=1303443 RepID=A0A9W4UGE9_9PLEO|nr:unnamed protein product [Periconia digitata]